MRHSLRDARLMRAGPKWVRENMTANIERQVDLSLWLFFEMTVFLSFSYNINVVFNCFYCNVTIIYSILI